MKATKGSPRVYADGIFDLFHTSHLEFMRKARAVGGPDAVLVIGVITDEAAIAYKRPPVVPYPQRLEMLQCCNLVDEVVPNPPLVLTGEFLDEHQITHVVHGDDDLQEDFFSVPRSREMMRYVPYTREGPLATSTSELIARIRSRDDLASPSGRPAGTGAPGEKGED
jgi:cytidyltransferase-like protein